MAPTFEAARKGYAAMWAAATVKTDRRSAAETVARRIIAGRARYEAVQRATGVPWWWIGAIHDRESGGDFRGVLHNGERIIGAGRKTRLVPKGRGPFSTWEEAATDALKLKGLQKITDWSPARMLYEAERFNGFGYVSRGVNSPYVWAGTNHQQRGKYVRDGVWSATAWDTQLGVAAVLRALVDVSPEVAARIAPAGPAKPAGAPRAAAPAVTTVPTPIALPDRPGLWRTLLGALVGRDPPVAAPPAPVARPGLAPQGDPALYDLQVMLAARGWTMVGRPDGLAGPNTAAAIRTFRAERELPAGDHVDDELRAALAKSGPREIAASRAAATARDLRQQGSSQVATLDSIGWLGRALGLGGVVGGIAESGVLDQARETLQGVQDTAAAIGSIATTVIGVVQWCVSHWWLLAIAAGLWLVFRAATGVLRLVVLFRQGVLTRADQ
ncbi:hypothetical protein RHODGE_RHODGE_01043 [Rhodoplanes serenus]|uniref:Peptidoglycan binding-like domain-containing protein n=1 Tax=Rhodoplanes serenus TaxID=200615 RepID=A0A3S4BEG2_9BRAD|nr:hypothetical protein [Rhodoplanes serenus]VCU06564.1 hypothetical protein RHODPL_RHODPL_00012 [Rhodoplanes serenus]VCU07893.1 hypothetical protein RHODGE_RHODGE_01043 [Rhodoplanes serenus]